MSGRIVEFPAGGPRGGGVLAEIETVVRPPRFRVTHVGEMFETIRSRCGALEARDVAPATPMPITREAYTAMGAQGLVTDPRDGQRYRLLLAPADSVIWGRFA